MDYKEYGGKAWKKAENRLVSLKLCDISTSFWMIALCYSYTIALSRSFLRAPSVAQQDIKLCARESAWRKVAIM